MNLVINLVVKYEIAIFFGSKKLWLRVGDQYRSVYRILLYGY